MSSATTVLTSVSEARGNAASASASLPTVRILGCQVHLISLAQTVDHIEAWIHDPERRCRRVGVTGFHGLWKAYESPHVREALNGAELWVPDGIAPVWVAHFRGLGTIERVPGAEIMSEFFRRAARNGYSSYFYGDTQDTLDILQRKVGGEFPGHRIAGSYSPPFRQLTAEEDQEIVDRINAAQPDVLWVGLGMPKQDLWIHEHRDRLKVPVAIGVGAAFRFVAGTVPRCPDWIGRMGFEWAYRLSREPGKLWRRDLIDGPLFLFHLGLELAGFRSARDK